MNTVDIIVAVILLYALVKGWTGGIIVQLAGIAGIIAGIWAASRFSDWVAGVLGMDNANEDVMYIITLIVVMIAVILLLKLMDKLLKSVGLSVPLRILGVIFSVGKWLIVLTLLLSVYRSISVSWHMGMSKAVTDSIFYKPLVTIEKNVFPYFTEMSDKSSKSKSSKSMNDTLKTI